jgi:hypothetical protein
MTYDLAILALCGALTIGSLAYLFTEMEVGE